VATDGAGGGKRRARTVLWKMTRKKRERDRQRQTERVKETQPGEERVLSSDNIKIMGEFGAACDGERVEEKRHSDRQMRWCETSGGNTLHFNPL